MPIFHIAIFLLCILLSSCGSHESVSTSGAQSSDQTSGSPGTGEVQPGPTPIQTVYGSAALIWGDLQKYQADSKLSGDSEHAVDPSKFSQTQMRFNGVVKSNSQSRDIVLVVDVSGSTWNSDPVRYDGKCARYDAVNSVINLAKAQSDARFAVITFDTDVVRRSRGFFSGLEQMFVGERPEDILCRHGYTTNYKSALESANGLFNSYAIASHLKELYFVTDGEPTYISGSTNYRCNFQDFCSGIPEARALKDSQVILGTVMLGGSQYGSDYLRNYIAGLGPDNLKLHARADNSSQLVEKLTVLAADNLVSGTIYYRDLGARQWSVMDMIPITQAGEFQSVPIGFDFNQFPHGLEVQIRYTTSRGFSHSGYAIIRWQ